MSATSWEVLDRTGAKFSGSAGGVSNHADCGLPWENKWAGETYLLLGMQQMSMKVGKDYKIVLTVMEAHGVGLKWEGGSMINNNLTSLLLYQPVGNNWSRRANIVHP